MSNNLGDATPFQPSTEHCYITNYKPQAEPALLINPAANVKALAGACSMRADMLHKSLAAWATTRGAIEIEVHEVVSALEPMAHEMVLLSIELESRLARLNPGSGA